MVSSKSIFPEALLPPPRNPLPDPTPETEKLQKSDPDIAIVCDFLVIVSVSLEGGVEPRRVCNCSLSFGFFHVGGFRGPVEEKGVPVICTTNHEQRQQQVKACDWDSRNDGLANLLCG